MGTNSQTIKVGITGHQARPGLDWAWVKREIAAVLSRQHQAIDGYSSLSIGSDQIFAETVLERGGRSVFVLPHEDIESTFESGGLTQFEALRRQSSEIRFPHDLTGEDAYLFAGQWIVLNVDALVAVWDGQPAHGRGGTGDIVDFARATALPVYHIDTANQRASWLPARATEPA